MVGVLALHTKSYDTNDRLGWKNHEIHDQPLADGLVWRNFLVRSLR